MNRFILTILFLFFVPTFLFAQEFEVRSFTKDSKDISAIRFPRKDVNNQSAAIIKVRTNLHGLNYNCNSGFIGDPIEKDGDIWLYVSPKEKRIKFMKEGFLALDYQIEDIIEPSSVYILELINKFQSPIKAGSSIGFIVIKSQPTGAQVRINGEPTGTTTPFQKPLNPGQYSFELTRTLYQSYSGTFIITAGNTITEEVSLVPNFGSLYISTNPENGASIYIDDKIEEKATPASFDQLPPGSHKLTIVKEFFETVSMEFNIQKGAETNLNIDLQPTFGEIVILAPVNTKIWIDQQQAGNDTYKGKLLNGIHLIEVKAPYHYDFSKVVTIEVGQTIEMKVNMIPQTGILTIMAEPVETTVTIDGIDKGKTPLILNEVIIGPHIIKLSKNGYLAITRQIDLHEGQTLEVYDTLLIETENKPIITIESPSITNESMKRVKQLDTGTFTDARDDQTYKWVKIGTQVWMAENLNYVVSGSSCFKDQPTNCNIYGRLYNWETALIVCPQGWHLPSNEEWGSLVDFLGGKSIAGGKMKESGSSHWKSPNSGATNSSGFSALPGGRRNPNGTYSSLTYTGYFWSSTDLTATKAWGRYLDYYDGVANRYSFSDYKSCGRSVRCIQDK